MRRSARFALTGLFAIAMAGWAMQADAGEVSIVGFGPAYTFTGSSTPANSITMSTAGFNGTAFDTTNLAPGTYTFAAITATSICMSLLSWKPKGGSGN